MTYGVILAGGRGERFWPLSRKDRPKQFLRLTSKRTLLEETIDRVLPLIPGDNIRIVTNQSMSQLIHDSLGEVSDQQVLTEPKGKNTCVAIGLAAVHLRKEDPEAIMVVLSADHLISPAEKLLSILQAGASIAATEDRLITIGIVPTRPEIGYGYIRIGDLYREVDGHSVFEVSAFTEKPKAAVASEYYYSRKYFWNSGMFIWSAKSILKAIDDCQPDLFALLEEYSSHIDSDKEGEARELLYERADALSIDVAVLELADNVLTIRGDLIWDDIGGWRAMERFMSRDGENNVVVGKALLSNSFETTVYNECPGLVACLGVSDLVIVRSGDITLVANRTQVGDLKKFLASMEEDEELRQYL